MEELIVELDRSNVESQAESSLTEEYPYEASRKRTSKLFSLYQMHERVHCIEAVGVEAT
jgi:hypothetical protein